MSVSHRKFGLIVTGGLAVVAAVGWLMLQRSLSAPERLLADAYTARRTMELRFGAARHGPMRAAGPAVRSRLGRPAALQEGAAIVARQLNAHPRDPAWIAAQARVDLLEWNYEAAITGFQRALEMRPDAHDLLIDLASAYFQRAQALDRAVDYASAIESLSLALANKPNDPVALFNRAIAHEKMFLYGEAAKDWHLYLRIEPEGAWANEARQRLDIVRQKMRRQ